MCAFDVQLVQDVTICHSGVPTKSRTIDPITRKMLSVAEFIPLRGAPSSMTLVTRPSVTLIHASSIAQK